MPVKNERGSGVAAIVFMWLDFLVYSFEVGLKTQVLNAAMP